MKTINISSRIILIMLLLMLSLTTVVNANEESIENVSIITSGTYYQLGKYNDKPIIWRSVVSDDENGILMVSDKILSYRIFNTETDNKATNHWEKTAMRVWLNSDAASGEVEWVDEYVPSSDNIDKDFTPYADESRGNIR